jgi:hypothetical protein
MEAETIKRHLIDLPTPAWLALPRETSVKDARSSHDPAVRALAADPVERALDALTV